MPTYRLHQGNTLLLQGPAYIKLRTGSADCLSAPISTSDWTYVERSRQIPVHTIEDSLLEIKFGPGSGRKEVPGSTIPTSWSEASQVLCQSPGVAVIVGDVDTGKSTLCTFLANESIKRGLNVRVIDADVGQADIGPPTTISSSQMKEPILGLQDLKPQTSFFIGDTSPSSVPAKLTQSLVRLKRDLTSSTDIVIVNTDGWIGDTIALGYKSQLLSEANPDIVLGLARSIEINPLLDLVAGTSLKLESSHFAKARTKEDRKRIREAGYQRFLRGSKPLRIRIDEVKLRVFDQPNQTVFAGNRNFRGRITGLLREDNTLQAIGRFREVRGGIAIVETQTIEVPTVLELGAVVLSPKFGEVGYNSLH